MLGQEKSSSWEPAWAAIWRRVPPPSMRDRRVVAWDVMFDMGAVARRNAPAALFWLREHGVGFLVDCEGVLRAKRPHAILGGPCEAPGERRFRS
jgi:hypothetical protein